MMLQFLFLLLSLCFHPSRAAVGFCGTPPSTAPSVLSQIYTRPSLPAGVTAPVAIYQPMRIRIFETVSLETLEKEAYERLMSAVDETVNFYQNFLLVRPIARLHVAQSLSTICYGEVYYHDLRESEKTVHQNESNGLWVSGYDTAIYVTFTSSYCAPHILAWAWDCHIDRQTGRPVVGQLNLCRAAIDKGRKPLITVLKHEMMHIFGVAQRFFHLPSTGMFEEKVPWKVRDDYTSERRYNLTAASVSYPKTLAAIRDHFACASLKGIRLENTGRPGTSNAHWDKLIFGNELMTGSIDEEMLLSNITVMYLSELKLVTDSKPFYEINLSAVEKDIANYWYGKHLGCTFATESCRSYIDETVEMRDNLLHPAFPYCAPHNLPEAAEVCCGDLRVKSRCRVTDVLDDQMSDHTKTNKITKEEWLHEYGYLEDTTAKGYYGEAAEDEFCPVLTMNRMILPETGCKAFHSCTKGADTGSKPATSSTQKVNKSTTQCALTPTPPTNSSGGPNCGIKIEIRWGGGYNVIISSAACGGTEKLTYSFSVIYVFVMLGAFY